MSHRCLCSSSCKLTIVLSLTSLYFFSELIVGSWIKSLALVADSFHMLSDAISIIIGIVAIKVSSLPKSGTNTFGWQRAEVYGTLINCVSLVTLCFTITISAIQRFILPELIEQHMVMLGVGAGGLAINLIGLLILNPFTGHHHGHSHGGPSSATNTPGLPNIVCDEKIPDDEETINEIDAVKLYTSMKINSHSYRHSSELSFDKIKKTKPSMNMKAVFFHVITDLLGSIVVCVSAIILMYAPGLPKTREGEYKLYVDPVLSLVLVVIIIGPTIVLLKQSSLILLQSVPKEINLTELLSDLHNIDDVLSIHDLHVWRLRPTVIIATTHVKVSSISEYTVVSQTMKQIFHKYDIHCTTIQPEFVKTKDGEIIESVPMRCDLDCGPRSNCQPDVCCPD